MTGPLSETGGKLDLRVCTDALGPLSATSRRGARAHRTPLCSDLERAAAEFVSCSDWLSPLLLKNPGLYEMIADLPSGGVPSNDALVVLDTALLLAGKYKVPSQPDNKDGLAYYHLLGMQVRITVDRRSASLLLTENPGFDKTWKIVATTNDEGEPIQEETKFYQKRSDSLLSAFLLLKRFHAENEYDHRCGRREPPFVLNVLFSPVLTRLIADSPDLAERIASLPTELPNAVTAFGRSMALLVAGKLPVPKGTFKDFDYFGQRVQFHQWNAFRSGNLLLVPPSLHLLRWALVLTSNDDEKPLQLEIGGRMAPDSDWTTGWFALVKKLQTACEAPECVRF
jgi:hypothetical protein